MADVLDRPGGQVVEDQHVMAVLEEPLGEM
jgi:hypothetical protein